MTCTYEEEYGKLDLPLRPSSKDLALVASHGNGSMDVSGQELYTELDNGSADIDDPSLSPARAYAELYRHPVVRSVLIAEKCMRLSRRDHRVEEARLWSLLLDLLLDAEQSSKYNPDAIGLASVQPHRRWYLSHHAHVQDLLQRQPLLRRMNIILRWLEQTYREGHTPLRLSTSLSPEEAVLLRQLILSHLRGGELHRAIDLAVTARDCAYSCVLSAAQLQTVSEPWLHLTPLVPLFGEYGGGRVDRAWAGNARRLDNLSQLHADSAAPGGAALPAAAAGLDAVIAAVLCGNLAVMEPVFLASGSWRDALWCHLRATLVLCTTRALMAAGFSGVRPAYAALVERATGAGDKWAETAARDAVERLAARLRDTFLPRAALEEQLQMRVILQFLDAGDGMDWLAVSTPSAPGGKDDAARLIAHALLCVDVAHDEALHTHAVQLRSDCLAAALAQHAQALAQLLHITADDAAGATVAMALRLRNVRQRASIYAAFLVAVRERALAQPGASRGDVERCESRLVRFFCRADGSDALQSEVVALLQQRTSPAARLTENATTELLLWRAMHASSPTSASAVLRDTLDACVAFWLASPRLSELDAISDAAAVLRRHVFPALAPRAPNNNAAAEKEVKEEDEEEIAEAQFWIALAAARAAADTHARSAAKLDVAAGAERTLMFQLAQEESARLRELHAIVSDAINCGGAAVKRAHACVTAVAWIAQIYAEEAALSARLAPASAAEERLREVFALVQRMDALGYIDERLLPQESASELFDAIRAVRVAVGQRAHDEIVADARKAAAAQVCVDGYGEGAEE